MTNMPIEELCDLHDKSYTRQAVLDNHLNARTREVVRTLDAWELHQALPLEESREAYNPHQAVYLIVVV